MNALETQIGSVVGAAILVKLADGLFSLTKTSRDRMTARESNVDAATKTAIEAMQAAVKQMREELDAEKGKRGTAEQDVATLRLAVEALASRIEEQDKDLAGSQKLKTENQQLKRQVTELQKQVKDLKARIGDLEQSRELVVAALTLDTPPAADDAAAHS